VLNTLVGFAQLLELLVESCDLVYYNWLEHNTF